MLIISQKNRLDQYVYKHFDKKIRKWTKKLYYSHLENVATKSEKQNIKFGYEIGLLHDIYEDTEVKPHEVVEFLAFNGYTKEDAYYISNCVLDLTKHFTKEKFPALNREQRANAETKRLKGASADIHTIKYFDIMDNCKDVVDVNKKFARIYLPEKLYQLKELDKGDVIIRNKAIQIIKLSIKYLNQQFPT